MRHTTEIKLANLKDIILAEAGIIKPEEIRQITVEDAIVDTGATRLSLPKSLIEQLGLAPVGHTRARTTNGVVNRTIYSTIKFTVLERSGTIEVTELPEDVPVLVGHIVLEMLDLCLDIRNGLMHNPANDGEWTEDQF